MSTAHLKAKLSLDSSQYERALKSAAASGKRLAAQMARSGIGAGKALGGAIASGVKKSMIGLGISGVLAPAGLAAGIAAAVKLGEEHRKLSRQTNVAAGRLLAFGRALGLTGEQGDMLHETMDRARGSIERVMEAGDHEGFRKLGVDLEKIKKLSPDQQFIALSDAVYRIPSSAARASAAMNIFGEAGKDVLRLYESGGAIHSAGVTLGRQAKLLTENAASFSLVSERLKSSGVKLQGFFVGIADKLVKHLIPVLDRLDSMDFTKWGQAFGDKLIDGAKAVVGMFKEPQIAVEIVKDTLGLAASSFNDVLKTGMDRMMSFFKDGMADTIKGIGKLLMAVLMEAFREPLITLQAEVKSALAWASSKLDDVQLGTELENHRQLRGNRETARKGHEKYKARGDTRMENVYANLMRDADDKLKMVEHTIKQLEERKASRDPEAIKKKLREQELTVGGKTTGQWMGEAENHFSRAGAASGKVADDNPLKWSKDTEGFMANIKANYAKAKALGAPVIDGQKPKKEAINPVTNRPYDESYWKQRARDTSLEQATEERYGKDAAQAMLKGKGRDKPISEEYKQNLINKYGRQEVENNMLTSHGSLKREYWSGESGGTPPPIEGPKQGPNLGRMMAAFSRGALESEAGMASRLGSSPSAFDRSTSAFGAATKIRSKKQRIEDARKAEEAKNNGVQKVSDPELLKVIEKVWGNG